MASLMAFNLKKQTQIKAIEMKISNRKKQFGVEYLTMAEERDNAGKRQYFKDTLKEIKEMRQQIKTHQEKMEERKVEEEENKKQRQIEAEKKKKEKQAEKERKQREAGKK